MALTLGANGRVIKSRRLPIDAAVNLATFGADNVLYAGTGYPDEGVQRSTNAGGDWATAGDPWTVVTAAGPVTVVWTPAADE